MRAAPNADILVNNLGIYETKDFAAITDADWRHYFEVNVLSGVRLARAYFPGMLERNWDRIIRHRSQQRRHEPPARHS